MVDLIQFSEQPATPSTNVGKTTEENDDQMTEQSTRLTDISITVMMNEIFVDLPSDLEVDSEKLKEYFLKFGMIRGCSIENSGESEEAVKVGRIVFDEEKSVDAVLSGGALEIGENRTITPRRSRRKRISVPKSSSGDLSDENGTEEKTNDEMDDDAAAAAAAAETEESKLISAENEIKSLRSSMEKEKLRKEAANKLDDSQIKLEKAMTRLRNIDECNSNRMAKKTTTMSNNRKLFDENKKKIKALESKNAKLTKEYEVLNADMMKYCKIQDSVGGQIRKGENMVAKRSWTDWHKAIRNGNIDPRSTEFVKFYKNIDEIANKAYTVEALGEKAPSQAPDWVTRKREQSRKRKEDNKRRKSSGCTGSGVDNEERTEAGKTRAAAGRPTDGAAECGADNAGVGGGGRSGEDGRKDGRNQAARRQKSSRRDNRKEGHVKDRLGTRVSDRR